VHPLKEDGLLDTGKQNSMCLGSKKDPSHDLLLVYYSKFWTNQFFPETILSQSKFSKVV
jgi:hypothetical protein